MLSRFFRLFIVLIPLAFAVGVLSSAYISLAQDTEVELPKRLFGIRWQPQGERLLVLGLQNNEQWGVWVYDVSFRILRLFSLKEQETVRWSPDGTRFSIGRDVIDAKEFNVVLTLDNAGSDIGDWSQDGSQLLAWADVERTKLGLYNATTGELIRQIPISEKPDGVAWSPNNAYFLLAQPSGTVEIVSAENGNLISTLDTTYAMGLNWSPDSQYIAGSTFTPVEPGTPGALPYSSPPAVASVVVWEVSTGKAIQVFSPLQDLFTIIRWHPYERQLIGGSPNGLINVWDTNTGDLTNAFTIPEKLVDLSFSPFGGRLTLSTLPPMTPEQIEALELQRKDFPQEQYWSQSFADNRLKSIVFDATIEKLKAVEEVCLPQASVIPSSLIDTLTIDTASATSYIEAVHSDPTIPAGCAADIIAVAEALQAEQESR